MTSRYSFIYDLCQEKIIQVELYESCVQEFDRADALYQQGMKVDPGNANLLVRHLEYKCVEKCFVTLKSFCLCPSSRVLSQTIN